jgi:hypothetical protein
VIFYFPGLGIYSHEQAAIQNYFRRAITMRKFELYPEYRDLFEYFGSNEIERTRIRGGHAVRRDWFVFDSSDEAMMFFNVKVNYFPDRSPSREDKLKLLFS